jgi:hypothetical protein
VTTADATAWLLDAGFAPIGRRSPAGVPEEISFVTGNLQL